MTVLSIVNFEDCKTYCNDVYILCFQLSKCTRLLIDQCKQCFLKTCLLFYVYAFLRTEEGVGYPEAGIVHGCELPCTQKPTQFLYKSSQRSSLLTCLHPSDGLKEKCTPYAQLSEHLIHSGWDCLSSLLNLQAVNTSGEVLHWGLALMVLQPCLTSVSALSAFCTWLKM